MPLGPIFQLLPGLKIDASKGPRWLAIRYGRSWDTGERCLQLHQHPTLYKTLSGAKRGAGRDGYVLLFDPSRLAITDSAAIISEDRNDELQFAERQMLAWAEVAEDIKRLRSHVGSMAPANEIPLQSPDAE